MVQVAPNLTSLHASQQVFYVSVNPAVQLDNHALPGLAWARPGWAQPRRLQRSLITAGPLAQSPGHPYQHPHRARTLPARRALHSLSAYARPRIVQGSAGCDPAPASTLNAAEHGQLKADEGHIMSTRRCP